MKITIFGLGYVGCTTAACLAHDGHSVTGVDINPSKVAQIQNGQSPIVEAGLDELIQEGIESGRLRATVYGHTAVSQSDISLICVGTPSNGNGSLNYKYIENVGREIGAALKETDSYHVVVLRSTALPGTVCHTLVPLLEEYSQKRAGTDFGVCMNPEFMREGSAIKDYYHPSQIVIGELDQQSGELLEQMYASVQAPVVHTTIEVAETVKYVSNAFHALKVAFANEIGNFCKVNRVDGREVMSIFAQDTQLNISAAYLKPGYAFGGSCLPKDLRALSYRAKEKDLDIPVLNAVMQSNQQQIDRGIQMVEKTKRKKIGILGLSFKAGTDDVRESPAVPLIETLIGRGYDVAVYDEKVELARLIGTNKQFLEQEIPHIASLLCSSLEEIVQRSEVIVVTNPSAKFKNVYTMMKKEQILLDFVGIMAQNNGEMEGLYEGICW